MKTSTYLFIALAALTLAGCREGYDPDVRVDGNYHSFIGGFVTPDRSTITSPCIIDVDEAAKVISYKANSFGGWENCGFSLSLDGDDRLNYGNDQAEYKTKLRDLGDTNYSGPTFTDNYALECSINKINVTCDDDYNAGHTAGSPANDLFEIIYQDMYAYVKNGYKPTMGSYQFDNGFPNLTKAKLNEANLGTKPYLNSKFYFRLLEVPSSEALFHYFTFDLFLSNGKTVRFKYLLLSLPTI